MKKQKKNIKDIGFIFINTYLKATKIIIYSHLLTFA